MVPALCGHPACSELGQDLSLRQSGREGVEGRGAGAQGGGVCHVQVGPQSSCQQTDPPPLTHTHLDVCRFGFPQEGEGRNSLAILGTQCATTHLAEEAGKGAATAGKLQASPAPSYAGDSLPVDGAGIPCPRQPSEDRLLGADGAPGGLCTTLRPQRLALRDLWWKLQDFLPPGVFDLAYPWWHPQP